MKLFITLGLLTIISGVFALFQTSKSADAVPQTNAGEQSENVVSANKQAVLVELFTSEGCSSCPPADRVLAQIAKQPNADADVITLSLHVDYWDSAVWRDPFSSLSFSKRQDIYSARLRGDNYTPQMIVDGQTAFVGSDANKARKAIADAAKSPKAKIELAQSSENNLKIKIADAPAHENATVFLAITEDNLSSSVRGGENSGRRLEHASVVRELKSLGVLTAAQTSLEMENAFQTKSDWKKENLKFVVFLQENATRKIFGANRINLK